jgi:hypothetical protein
MELLLSDYCIENIRESSDFLGKESKTLVWVWHADKIPPHIGISTGARYFSLKANGKDEMLPLESVMEIIDRKNIKTLCFELTDVVDLDVMKEIFSKYEKTTSDQITCLNPVKEVLCTYEASKLIEVLDSLYEEKRIMNVYGFHIDGTYSGIKDYSLSDIHDRLKSLEND